MARPITSTDRRAADSASAASPRPFYHERQAAGNRCRGQTLISYSVKPLLVLLVLLVVVAPAGASSTDVVRQQFADYYTAASAPRDASELRDSLNGLEDGARTLTAVGLLRTDGSWSDINYSDTPSGSWSPWAHFQRLTILARAYRTPGQSFYGSPQLRTQIEAALSFVPTFYGPLTWPSGNWWFWTIGAPLDLGTTLVLMRGDISQKVQDDCVRTLSVHIGSSAFSKGLVGPTPVGENLVWSSYTHLCLGLLRDDPVMLATVRAAMATVCAATTDDGIQPDHSFHQHGPQLYTGGYGGSFANDVAKYEVLTRGTEYALPDDALANFASYLVDGVAWSLRGQFFDVSVVGREVARPTTSGYNGLAALLQAAQFDSPRRAEIRADAAALLRSWPGTLPTELTAFAIDLRRSVLTPASPLGHQHYFTSDYSIHRRAGWYASVKMFSSRTKSGERTNGENLFGSRQSDGRFYLVKEGGEYFQHDVWPAFDWSRLPGITVEQKPDAANDTYGFGARSIVGGTGDGQVGVAAMDYAPLNSMLTAKKSWFFFDDSIVFLTSGITSPSSNDVETIIEQRPLSNPASPLVRGTNWVWSDGIGYYVYPQSAPLRVFRPTRSGTWASLGASTDTTPHTATFLTILLDHGVSPVAAEAAYVVIPDATAESMRTYVPPAILANGAAGAAVRSGNVTGVVFWTAGAIAGVQSTIPAVLSMTTTGNTMHLSAADPTNGSGSYQVTIPGAWNSTSLPTAIHDRATTVTLARNGGRTVDVILIAASGRRRSTR